eukprot:7632989-Pyramimonas_sp.AAC.2
MGLHNLRRNCMSIQLRLVKAESVKPIIRYDCLGKQNPVPQNCSRVSGLGFSLRVSGYLDELRQPDGGVCS